jgi:hypothetical protein
MAPVRRAVVVVTALLLMLPLGVALASDRHSPAPPPVQGLTAGSGAGIPPATARLLARQLRSAQRFAMHYPTLAKALHGGFTLAAAYTPGVGSHYMRYDWIYKPFDAARPDMLLFDGDAPSSHLVGLAYYIYDSQGPPDGFAGPFDHWHQHQFTCVSRTGAHFEGDDDAVGCRRAGRNAWMLHVWVTPSYQSVKLVFSNFCEILT